MNNFEASNPIGFFSEELRPGILLVSCKAWEMQGGATVNSWLVLGNKKAVLVDTGLPVPGLRAFVETLTSLPVMVVLSHGHFDHTGCNDQFDEVWIHPADEPLLKVPGGFGGSSEPPVINYKINHILPGDTINLGGRVLQAYGVRGHTFGSIVLYDAATKSLLSGDAIARRCFYSPSGWTPISTYFADIREIDKLDFDGILSAHDRYILPKNLIGRLISTITEEAPKTDRTWGRGETQYLWFVVGSGPEDPDFIDFSAPLGKKEELLADLKNMR